MIDRLIKGVIKWLEKQTLNEFKEIIVNEESVGYGWAHEAEGAVLGISPPESDSSGDKQDVNQRNHFNEETLVDERDGYDLREGRQQELFDRVLHDSGGHLDVAVGSRFDRINYFGLDALRDHVHHVEEDPRDAEGLVAQHVLQFMPIGGDLHGRRVAADSQIQVLVVQNDERQDADEHHAKQWPEPRPTPLLL